MNEDFVHWDDAYLVGFDMIDNQHKALVKMANTLFEGYKKGSPEADMAFMKTIRNAVEYAQTHFYTEEKYMKQTDYPYLPDHKEEHGSFIATVVQAVKEFEEEEKSDPLALARFLKEWLLNHIAKSDKKYAPYLAMIKTIP